MGGYLLGLPMGAIFENTNFCIILILFENSCTRVYGNWQKMKFDIILKIHVPGSTNIGKR